MFELLSEERKKAQKTGLFPEWYTTQAYQLFKSYSVAGEEGFKGRVTTIAYTLANELPEEYRKEYANKFLSLMWEGKLSPASPVLSNTGTTRGMPVSCSGQVVNDSVDSFFSNLHTTAMLSKNGFGTSVDLSNIRKRGEKISAGGKSNGVVPIAELFFTTASTISQGGNRRGAVACYLDVEHDDFDELCDLLLHNPDGKNVGWIIRDSFTNRLKAGDVKANESFNKLLYTKLVTGKGYLFFVDKANRLRPEAYKVNELDVKASNLCSEISLHSSEDYDFSCILSSLNLVHADKFLEEGNNDIFDSLVFLDCLCSYFLRVSKGVKGLEKVRAFTEKGRAVGLGVMGLHTYFQSKGIPFVSLEAQFLDTAIFKRIHDETLRASKWLASILGEPDWCKGLGIRNTHRTALAPTKSTALLMGGVSESFSPDPGIVFDIESSKGQMRRIVPVFYELMKARGVYNEETLQRIVNHNGSVQQEGWLSDHEKLVFLNAYEIDQEILLRRASLRQKYICQAQSLNFFVPEDGCEKTVAKLISRCFTDPNIISQYYLYPKAGVVVKDECVACSA